ncbi:nucleoid DNA-binding protein/glycerol-3-phosphate cytidylyltransferase-like family protein [Dysgonomonadaceae bacterium PH5-43]|nr:nucleoid DNA-binding protein/glycerol-3-phosphate cytidylyltransferase-like family protein [Dysgonomonadaceae bacterium PH5-43]
MNEKITTKELVALLSEKTDISKKEAEVFVKEYFNLITEQLLEEKSFKVRKIGTFKLTQVKERESVDVNKGTRLVIPSHYKVSYTPDTQLAKEINAPFASFEPTEINVDDTELSEEQELVTQDVSETIQELEPQQEPETQGEPEIQENISDKVDAENDLEENNTVKVTGAIVLKQKRKKEKNMSINKKSIFKWIVVCVFLAVLVAGYIHFGVYEEEYNSDFVARPFVEKNKGQELADTLVSISTSETIADIEVEEPAKMEQEKIVETESKAVVETKPEESFEVKPEKIVETKPDKIVEVPAKVVEKQDTIQKTVAKINSVKKRKLQQGDRLTVIALEEYGHKSFWIYIYEENKALIKDPDNVKAGIELIIPNPEKYGIDKTDSASIQKAKSLVKQYKR